MSALNFEPAQLLQYNHDSNLKLFKTLTQLNLSSNHRIIALAHHILNAQEIWLMRILGQIPQVGVWEIREGQELEMLEEKYFEILSHVDFTQLSEMINYKNSQGIEFKNTVSDIVFHVINHGTYHRAQINLLLRQEGFEPINCDYIFYKR